MTPDGASLLSYRSGWGLASGCAALSVASELRIWLRVISWLCCSESRCQATDMARGYLLVVLF